MMVKMKIMGENGVGSILKFILQICFVIGIIILVVLPFSIPLIGDYFTEFVIELYPNGICFLIIVKQFIGLFDSLKNNNPFCDNTVKRLKTSGIASTAISILLAGIVLYEMFLAKGTPLFIVITCCLCVLFIGVSIAFYILAELFKQAIQYKKENELTI